MNSVGTKTFGKPGAPHSIFSPGIASSIQRVYRMLRHFGLLVPLLRGDAPDWFVTSIVTRGDVVLQLKKINKRASGRNDARA